MWANVHRPHMTVLLVLRAVSWPTHPPTTANCQLQIGHYAPRTFDMTLLNSAGASIITAVDGYGAMMRNATHTSTVANAMGPLHFSDTILTVHVRPLSANAALIGFEQS
jgi:hypothetical protein